MRAESWLRIDALRDKERLVKEFNEGLTKADIRRKYGCSRTSVDRAVAFHGIDYDKIKLAAAHKRVLKS